MDSSTLAGAFLSACDQWAGRVALTAGEEQMSYGQLRAAALGLAGAYRHLGICRGDRVICCTGNSREYVVAMAAAWLCGGVHVGIDYQSTARELAEVARLVQAKAIVYEPSRDNGDAGVTIESLRGTFPLLKFILVGKARPLDGCHAFWDLANSPNSPMSQDLPGPEDHAIIFISSGTTGTPKATIGYQGNLGHRWRRLGGWLGFTSHDIHLAHLPLSHGFGLMMATAALFAGGSLILQDGFSGEAALELIVAHRINVFNGAPTHFMLLLKHLDPARHDVGSLRFSVGTAAHFSPNLVREIWQKLRVKFMFMYGSSEGVGVATMDREDILLGSVGRPAPGAVRIVDHHHQAVPVAETGEIAFSRSVYPVRYWEESTEGRSDEWYYSGDLGRLDEAGRLFVSGRLKQQIDRGGLKVDPLEVANALLRCPEVGDAAVVGIPNPVLGATVCACIVPTTQALPPTLERLREYLRTELAPYKLPESLRILDEIPRTRLGKIDAVALDAKLAESGVCV